MKKLYYVVLLLFFITTLTGCNSKLNHITPEEFDETLYGHGDMTRISYLLSASRRILGTDKEAFADIVGWTEETKADGFTVLSKPYNFFGEKATVELVFDTSNGRINCVNYIFADVDTARSKDIYYAFSDILQVASKYYLEENGVIQEIGLSEFHEITRDSIESGSDITYLQVWKHPRNQEAFITTFYHSRESSNDGISIFTTILSIEPNI